MTSTTTPVAWKRMRNWAFATGLALSGVALSACGSSSDDAGSDSSTTAAASSSTDTSTGSDALADLTKPLDAYPVPTDAVDAKALSGKTIYYIPISQQAPQFSITAKGLTAAAAKVGAKVQVCDGKGTPTDIGACVGQATSAKAAAIIVDAIPYGLAANGLDAAQKAGIPVIVGNNIPDEAHPASKTLAYVGPEAGGDMEKALARFVIADSDGKANLLINADTDGPSPLAWVKEGQQIFDDECPDCKVATNNVSSANFNLVVPSTSSALLKDPNITYVQSQYEQFLQPTQTAIQQASRTGIKVLDGAAGIASVKAVEAGTLVATAGQASTYQGWVYLDAVARLTAGSAVPDYTIPVRLFTKDTLGDTKVTEAAQDSGEWFGPTTFTDDFAKLWGVA
ncbi:sugar ABC transporter substrate-binding protein [Nocardioides sp. Kera G14]|uniref:sugar ABC transporter substrate-binding protein n=1 Tax=Nocardioides sp. Kera G14 TaxID=2884264 RepID=UPI001D12D9EF|nr:substrate-binding domain-containing protein [Nocardioides sp. Kera G14]UDY23450.1 substrate-binding domain-containing protein [Nocardioides sp. Kera G14]